MMSEQQSNHSLAIDSQSMNLDLVFSFTCEPEDILDLFEKVAISLSFRLIERQTSYATAVKQISKPKGLLSLVNCCSWFQSDQFTAIKLVLSKQSRKGDVKDAFVAEIKGLVGIPSEMKAFFHLIKTQAVELGVNVDSSTIMLAADESPPIDPLQNENPYYLEACCYQLTSNLLQDSQEELSISMVKLLNDYKNNFRNIEESSALIPLPMKNAMYANHNQIDSQRSYPATRSVPHSKELPQIAVQKQVFNSLESLLFSVYRLRNIDTEKNFQDKKGIIWGSYTIRDILVEVCLNAKYWSVNKQKMDCILPAQKAKQQFLFNCVCGEFEKIVFTNCPREKVKHCQLAYTQLKTHFYDFSEGKNELASMEDIIPVLIVVVLCLEIGDLRSELDLMLDFINFDPSEMEAEKRLLINLSESYNYIYRDWVLK